MSILSRLHRFFFPRVADNHEFKIIYVSCPSCGQYHIAVPARLWPNLAPYKDVPTSFELVATDHTLIDALIGVDRNVPCPMCRSTCETTVCLSLMGRDGDDALMWFNQLVVLERIRFVRYDEEILKLEGDKLLIESRLAAWGLEDEVDNGDCDAFGSDDFGNIEEADELEHEEDETEVI